MWRKRGRGSKEGGRKQSKDGSQKTRGGGTEGNNE